MAGDPEGPQTMAREHKYHHSRLTIDTALPPEEALQLAHQTIETQRSVRLTGRVEGQILAHVKDLLGGKLLQFTVSAAPGASRTAVITEIVSYQTSQDTVLFIPIGPKLMDGYSAYRNYMRALQQVVTAADSGARCEIAERSFA